MAKRKALSRMTKAEMKAELQQLRGQSPKGTNSTVFKNVAGVECTNGFLANISSGRIVRHLKGTCGCRTSPTSRCAAVKRYKGMTRANFGSDPSVSWTPYKV